MSMYTIVFVLVTFLVLGALTLFFMFISWLDKKIDQKNRMGASAHKKDTSKKK